MLFRSLTSHSVLTCDDEKKQQQLAAHREDSGVARQKPSLIERMLGRTFKGKVVDSMGTPVDGAMVAYGHSASYPSVQEPPGTDGHCESDVNGDFQFNLSPASGYKDILAISETGFGEITWEQLEKTGQIEIRPWGNVSGVSRIGDEPVSNAIIRLAWFETRTDADGNYEFSETVLQHHTGRGLP